MDCWSLAHGVVHLLAGVVQFGRGPIARTPAADDEHPLAGEVCGLVVVRSDKRQLLAFDTQGPQPTALAGCEDQVLTGVALLNARLHVPAGELKAPFVRLNPLDLLRGANALGYLKALGYAVIVLDQIGLEDQGVDV